jgi:hypothetical protein
MTEIDVAMIPVEEGEEVLHKHLSAAREAAFAGDYRNYARQWKRFRQRLPSGHKLKHLTPENPSEDHMKQMAHGHSDIGGALKTARVESVQERAEALLENLDNLDEGKWQPHPSRPGVKVRHNGEDEKYHYEKTSSGRHKITSLYQQNTPMGGKVWYRGTPKSFKTARAAIRHVYRSIHGFGNSKK